MHIGDPLFARGSLSSYFEQNVAALRPFVEKYLSANSPGDDEEKFIAAIAAQACIQPLTIDFANPSKDVESVRVRVRDWGREFEIDGVRATRTFSFSGDSGLFQLRPNRWTSVIPYGVVSHGRLTIGIEDRNDPASLKSYLDDQQNMLRDYTMWQEENIREHNSALEPKIRGLVGARIKHLRDVQDLRDLI
jgi:hypothetical protein